MKLIACLAVILCALSAALGTDEGNVTLHCTGDCQKEDVNAKMPFVMRLKEEDHKKCVEELRCPTVIQAMGSTKCADGKAGEYECSNVYDNYAFIVSEARDHGMQVFDLAQLRTLTPSAQGVNRLTAITHYGEFGSAHNIVSNTDRGFMYVVGSRTCNSGLHIVNVRDPTNPQFAGCYGDDGYVHDAQCVVYNGPDADYKGHEVCFCYDENTLTIVDVEDKGSIQQLGRKSYQFYQYTHQGWLIEDHTHLLLNDELDELYVNPRTRSMIWSVEKLSSPELIGSFYSEKQATDHNLYIVDNLAYEANYCAGLRILDVTDIKNAQLKEVGFFDVAPDCNTPGFHGSWSSYPYFESGTIIVSSIERGLFVLKYTGPVPG